ncbi:LacI family DNA-binding transcriptional regulator [Sphingomonas sp.]|uniref:LacI family DNA-binding transcriptional regulator n=1 Tax=Sphingomonas sp. TaxID=28214 RepID=UPI002CABC00A|nr:LacI family DNA-binding transcriptional regulator [Sphingomonas sp.]HWK35242.1 LacI family DNA-binding transcriptional regulator [Sphingomonas sp.]
MVDATNGRRPPTLHDLARVVGLTANTVSRALNDRPGVNPTTRALIKAEAERLGYVPNVHARSLVLGSRKTIGVIVANISNPFFSDLVSEVEFQAEQAGYTVLLLLSYESADREREAIGRALRSGLDGLIAAPVQERSDAWTPVIRAGIPLVLVSRELPELSVDFYSTDNEAGIELTTEAVLARGARDVVLIDEDMPFSTIRLRIEGFRRSLEARGLPFDPRLNLALVPPPRSFRVSQSWHADDAHRVASDLLDRGRRPDAFVVGDDYYALGLYRALRERGIRVPDDVMVMGWGNHPFTRFMDPPLSTLLLPFQEVARRATSRLLDRIQHTADPEIVTERIVPELVIRASTSR